MQRCRLGFWFRPKCWSLGRFQPSLEVSDDVGEVAGLCAIVFRLEFEFGFAQSELVFSRLELASNIIVLLLEAYVLVHDSCHGTVGASQLRDDLLLGEIPGHDFVLAVIVEERLVSSKIGALMRS